MRNFLIKILFRLIKVPIAYDPYDNERVKDWLGLQYPLKEFQDYIAARNLYILQMLGEGVIRDDDYMILVGQRLELNRLLNEAKTNFRKAEKERNRKKKQNEALKKQKS